LYPPPIVRYRAIGGDNDSTTPVIVFVIIGLKLEQIKRNKKKEAIQPEEEIPLLYRLSCFFLSLSKKTHKRFLNPARLPIPPLRLLLGLSGGPRLADEHDFRLVIHFSHVRAAL